MSSAIKILVHRICPLLKLPTGFECTQPKDLLLLQEIMSSMSTGPSGDKEGTVGGCMCAPAGSILKGRYHRGAPLNLRGALGLATASTCEAVYATWALTARCKRNGSNHILYQVM